jgi:hypothetical protein
MNHFVTDRASGPEFIDNLNGNTLVAALWLVGRFHGSNRMPIIAADMIGFMESIY